MRALPLALMVALTLGAFGCGRYSYRIRNAYARGDYGMAATRCQGDAPAATTRWNAGHLARYHVYCGMTYLTMGDRERAASELVQAERMRTQNPRLVSGRDLDQLNTGLMTLFGVSSGQLLIEEQPASFAAAAPPPAPPADSAKLVTPPATPEAPEAPAALEAPPAPEAPAAPEVSAAPEVPTPPIAPTPIIVIPEDQADLIQ